MTLARLARYPQTVVPAPVADNVHFVAGVSDARSPTAGTSAGFSIVTIAGLLSDTRRCNNAPSAASAENSSHIPLANTAGSAAAVLDLSSLVGLVDFSEKLKDLDRGSWERSLPEGSSLGGDVTPLRGAFHFLRRGWLSTHTAPNSTKRPSILLTGFYPNIIFPTFV